MVCSIAKVYILEKVLPLTFINRALCIMTAYLQSYRLCAVVSFMTLKYRFIWSHLVAAMML
jgi:hypothetical protein